MLKLKNLIREYKHMVTSFAVFNRTGTRMPFTQRLTSRLPIENPHLHFHLCDLDQTQRPRQLNPGV